MRDPISGDGRLPSAFLTPGASSFADLLSATAPGLLPGGRSPLPSAVPEVPHGTTIVSLTHQEK